MRVVLRIVGALLVVASIAGLAVLAVGWAAERDPVVSAPYEAVSSSLAAGETPPDEIPPAPVADTPASTPVEQEPPPRIPEMPLLLDEEFVDNHLSWPSDPQSTAWLGEHGYLLEPREPGIFVAVGAPIGAGMGDVVVTATFHKLGGPPGGGYGVIVRDQSVEQRNGMEQRGRYYVLEVADRGEVGIWRRDGDRWADVVSWTPAVAVQQGLETNTLEVWAVGQRLTLLVNGVQVASQSDLALPSGGGVGVFVGGDGNHVELNRLQVRAASQGPPLPDGPPRVIDATSHVDFGIATPTPARVAEKSATGTPDLFRPITRVTIPSIALDAPSAPAGLITRNGAVTWEVPAFTIGHAQATAGAGGAGNAVLVGHVTSRNLGNVFERLHKARVSDLVRVFSGQQTFDYYVVDVRRVERTDVSVVAESDTPSLTLITCTGLWLPVAGDYAERLVVRAELADRDDPRVR